KSNDSRPSSTRYAPSWSGSRNRPRWSDPGSGFDGHQRRRRQHCCSAGAAGIRRAAVLAPQASVAPEWCTVTPKRFLTLAAVPLVLALTACGASTPAEVIAAVEQAGDDRQPAGSAGSAEMLSYDELPDCAEVASSAGDLIGDFVPSPDGHEGVNEQPLAIELSCVWLTPQTVDQDLSGLA